MYGKSSCYPFICLLPACPSGLILPHYGSPHSILQCLIKFKTAEAAAATATTLAAASASFHVTDDGVTIPVITPPLAMVTRSLRLLGMPKHPQDVSAKAMVSREEVRSDHVQGIRRTATCWCSHSYFTGGGSISLCCAACRCAHSYPSGRPKWSEQVF